MFGTIMAWGFVVLLKSNTNTDFIRMEKWSFSDETYAIVRYSSIEAQLYGNSCIGVEHLLLSMIDQEIPAVSRFFTTLDVDPQNLKTGIERHMNVRCRPDGVEEIHADIICDRDNHKPIIIGKKGEFK